MNKSQLTEALAKAENITLKKAEMVVNTSALWQRQANSQNHLLTAVAKSGAESRDKNTP